MIVMKYIKYITILVFQLSLLQFSIGQSSDNNGRPVGTSPGAAVENQETTKPVDKPNTNGIFSDFDVPSGEKLAAEEDTYYPVDMEIAKEEIMASTHPAEIAQKINDLNSMVEDLLRVTEELRLENKVIRESLGNCCSNASLGLSASDAYLLQNAPNPFNASSEIRYFVPNGLENVEVRISSIKGEELGVKPIKESGYGKILFDSDNLTDGTFVYSLFVNGQLIDSKVMIKRN